MGEQYKCLKLRDALSKTDIESDKVDGNPKKISGMVGFPVKAGGTTSLHKFCVTPDFCEEMFLGGDWLHEQGAKVKVQPLSIDCQLCKGVITEHPRYVSVSGG